MEFYFVSFCYISDVPWLFQYSSTLAWTWVSLGHIGRYGEPSHTSHPVLSSGPQASNWKGISTRSGWALLFASLCDHTLGCSVRADVIFHPQTCFSCSLLHLTEKIPTIYLIDLAPNLDQPWLCSFSHTNMWEIFTILPINIPHIILLLKHIWDQVW